MTAAAVVDHWTELLPDDVLPLGWTHGRLREVLDAGALVADRRAAVAEEIARLNREIDEGARNVDIVPSTLVRKAVREAAWRRIAAALPDIPGLPPEIAEAIVQGYAVRAFNDLGIGPPPLFASEMWHGRVAHPNELPAFADEESLKLIEAFESVSRANASIMATVRALTAPLNGSPLDARVHAIHEFVDGTLAEHRRLLEVLRDAVRSNEASRRASKYAHRCRLNNGYQVALLDAVPPGSAWTFETAVAMSNGRMLNGRPPGFVQGPA